MCLASSSSEHSGSNCRGTKLGWTLSSTATMMASPTRVMGSNAPCNARRLQAREHVARFAAYQPLVRFGENAVALLDAAIDADQLHAVRGHFVQGLVCAARRHGLVLRAAGNQDQVGALAWRQRPDPLIEPQPPRGADRALGAIACDGQIVMHRHQGQAVRWEPHWRIVIAVMPRSRRWSGDVANHVSYKSLKARAGS